MTSKTIDLLKQFLADSYILMLKSQNYHWNVTGMQFHEMHEFFEDMYTDLFEAVDDIAEHIRTLGEKSPGSFKAFSEQSEIDSEDIETTTKGMIVSLLSGQEVLSKRAHSLFKIAEEEKIDDIADFAIGRMQTHNKFAWMLRSHLE